MLRNHLRHVLAPALVVACSTSKVPDPRAAVAAYVDAEQRGDSDALYEMLSTATKRETNRDEVRRAVVAQREEHAARAERLAREDIRVEAVATLRFEDGEEAQLELRDGR